jgi:hypothetical protein
MNCSKTADRVYPKTPDIVLNAINDIVELQKGTLIDSDTENGRISFRVSMYSYTWEFCFTVSNAAKNNEDSTCSRVSLKAKGNRIGKETMIKQEMILLDSMLV